MKKFLMVFVLLGWFWGLRIPHPLNDKAIFNFVVGPFSSEIDCKADLEYAVGYFTIRIGEPSKIIACTERKDA